MPTRVVVIHDSYLYIPDQAARPVSERFASALGLSVSGSLHTYYELVDRVDGLAVLRPWPRALERAAAGEAGYVQEYERQLDSP